MSFSDDKLVFTQSHMSKSNIFIDKNGKICIFDFEDVVLLPESFSSYTMNVRNDPFVKGVASRYLRWGRSPNEDSIKWVGRILGMMGDATLGASISTSYRTVTNDGDRPRRGRPSCASKERYHF